MKFKNLDCNFLLQNGILTIDADSSLTSVWLCAERDADDFPTERWQYLCENTKVIIIRGNITKIPYPFFCHFVNLYAIVFPESLLTIGYLNFSDCPNLKFVHLPKNVKDVSGLRDTNNMVYIDVAEDNANFCSINGYLMSKNKKILIAAPGGLDVVEIPDGCESIGQEALTNTHSKIVIPSSVKEINTWNFHSDNLKEIVLGNYAMQYPLIEKCFTRNDSLEDEFKNKLARIYVH